MMIEQTEFITEVRGLSELSELVTAQLGDPCLVIVYGDASMEIKLNDALSAFFENAPFLTALASDHLTDAARALFDIVIPSEGAADYAAALFKDQSRKQAKEITSCFLTARKGTQAEILEAESRAFYRLISEKKGGNANG